MSKKIVQILKKYDESLNKAHINEYSLSTQISPGGFSFAIFHNVLNKYLSIESVEWEYNENPSVLVNHMDDFIKNHEWLSLGFPSVLVLFETS